MDYTAGIILLRIILRRIILLRIILLRIILLRIIPQGIIPQASPPFGKEGCPKGGVVGRDKVYSLFLLKR